MILKTKKNKKLSDLPIKKAKRAVKQKPVHRKGETATQSLVPKQEPEPVIVPPPTVSVQTIGSILATLDCNEFRDKLRMGLMNNSNLKLKINNNVVTKVD